MSNPGAVAVHEETGGLDIQLFADILADLDQIVATLAASAVLGLMPVLDARQMFRQRLATGAFALGGLGRRTRLFDFGIQRGFVGVPAFLEQLALFRGELFAFVGIANALVVGELEGQRLDFERVFLGLVEQLSCPFRDGGFELEAGEFGG